jgi:hypothetical protein
VEPLERRALFAGWTTVDVVPDGENWAGMAADAAGNVYVAGVTTDRTYVRQSSDGGASWGDVLTLPWSVSQQREIWGLAASPAGDVYVGVNVYGTSWHILKRPAGDTQFYQVHTASTGGLDQFNSVTVDANGQAYAIATAPVTVTTGGKTTTQMRSNVWKQTGAMGSFAIVDTFAANDAAYAISASTQGVYAVGRRSKGATTNQWFVRRSPTGAAGTWSTVDVFQHDPTNNLSSVANAVTVDTAGNVFVAGTGYKKVRTGGTDRRPIYTTTDYALVRASTDGGASWTTDVVGASTTIESIGADAFGNVYAAGGAAISAVANASVLLAKTVGTSTWSTIDQLDNAWGYGFTADASGNLYVAGGADGGPTGYYGFVRSQPAAATFSSTRIGAEGVLANFAADDSQDDELLVEPR